MKAVLGIALFLLVLAAIRSVNLRRLRRQDSNPQRAWLDGLQRIWNNGGRP